MFAAWLTLLVAVPGEAADTVLVCPPSFRAALAPWLEHRQAQGHQVVLVGSDGTPEQIRKRVRRVARGGSLRFVLLVGDAQPAGETDAALRARCVPTHFAPAKVILHWGSEPEIATDNWYADLDDDEVPDVAIGRLTVDSPEELSGVVQKIIAYEQLGLGDVWRRRVNVVAGMGGFGTWADAALEAATKSILTEGIPAPYATSMTYANWRSPYCPDPQAFHAATMTRLSEGCLFWVYIGHGQRGLLDRLRVPDGEYHILGNRDAAWLRSAEGAPVALFLACYSGAFDGAEDCLAEHLLRAAGGPVAVISGSRVTMPYAMSVLGSKLLAEYFLERRETLGELVLYAKRHMALDPRTDQRSRAIDALARGLNPVSADLGEERAEHLLLFNLLGDPLLRLRHPREARVEAAGTATAGSPLEVAGASPVDGEAVVELVVRRDRLTFQPPARRTYETSPAARAAYQRTYERANDSRLAWSRVPVEAGKFHARLEVPRAAWGECHVRVFVQGKGDFAAGAVNVTIRRPEPAAAAVTSGPAVVGGATRR